MRPLAIGISTGPVADNHTRDPRDEQYLGIMRFPCMTKPSRTLRVLFYSFARTHDRRKDPHSHRCHRQRCEYQDPSARATASSGIHLLGKRRTYIYRHFKGAILFSVQQDENVEVKIVPTVAATHFFKPEEVSNVDVFTDADEWKVWLYINSVPSSLPGRSSYVFDFCF